jgi:hypothetical protein
MATPPVPQPVPSSQGAASPPTPGAVTPPELPQPHPVDTATSDVQRQATVDELPGENSGIQLGFWQQPWVQDLLPLLTSLVLHIGIIGLGILTYQTAQILVSSSKEPVVIPDATIVENAEVGGIPHPGLGDDNTRDKFQDQFKDVPPDSTATAEKPSTSLLNALQGGGDTEDNLIASGAQSGTFGRGPAGIQGQGTGETGGGALAPFGVPGGGGGMGPKSPFMGVSGNAMKVVYLCDSSGSMMNKFDTLRNELRKACDSLKPVQAFDIIFFSEDKFIALDRELLLAVPETKRKAYDFLDKTAPHGSSDPIPGIQAAFKAGPQLIYMLTDGDFPNNQQVIEEIRKLNKDKRVKINTIAFMDRGEAYEKLLKQIADENGGLFKFVSDTDLQR